MMSLLYYIRSVHQFIYPNRDPSLHDTIREFMNVHDVNRETHPCNRSSETEPQTFRGGISCALGEQAWSAHHILAPEVRRDEIHSGTIPRLLWIPFVALINLIYAVRATLIFDSTTQHKHTERFQPRAPLHSTGWLIFT
jgi:hypothetical protein